MDTPSVPHFRFGRNAKARRRYFGQIAAADDCPPNGIPIPMMDRERIRRVNVVADALGYDTNTVIGIYWYLLGTCDELALGAFEAGRATRQVDA